MHAELQIPQSWPLAFALVLARMAGAFVFIPMPIKDAGPSMARIVFAFATAVALFPRWPAIDAARVTVGLMAGWLFSEAALGLSIGLVTAFLAEALTLGAQVLGLQAGYGYASVVDPTTSADSDVLQVLAQLTGGLLFFGLRLHHWIIGAFALSLERYPPGQFALDRGLAEMVIRLGSNIFTVGLRLALPIVGLLAMTEIALALLGRMTPQLHIGSSSVALKLLLALLALATVLKVAPNLYEAYADQLFGALRRALFE
jgi:flagellar biosynthesis protein FliR